MKILLNKTHVMSFTAASNAVAAGVYRLKFKTGSYVESKKYFR